MQRNSLRILQTYLWFICAFHAITGIGVNLSRPLLEMIAAGYGATVDFTPQFSAILHPLGAFMFILGVLAAVAARDPLRYCAITYSFAALFVIRALQRAIFKEQIEGAFQISSARNIGNIVVFLAMGISLALLQRYVEKRQSLIAAG